MTADIPESSTNTNMTAGQDLSVLNITIIRRPQRTADAELRI